MGQFGFSSVKMVKLNTCRLRTLSLSFFNQSDRPNTAYYIASPFCNRFLNGTKIENGGETVFIIWKFKFFFICSTLDQEYARKNSI
jgi:hypothetical protein